MRVPVCVCVSVCLYVCVWVRFGESVGHSEFHVSSLKLSYYIVVSVASES